MTKFKQLINRMQSDDWMVVGGIVFLLFYWFVILPWHWEIQCLELFGVVP